MDSPGGPLKKEMSLLLWIMCVGTYMAYTVIPAVILHQLLYYHDYRGYADLMVHP